MNATRDIDVAIPSVHPSVSSGHAGVVPKRLNLPSKFSYRQIVTSFWGFLGTKDHNKEFKRRHS